MGVKKIKVFKELPFEVGKTYLTKMATKWTFTVSRIDVDKKSGAQRTIHGFYNGTETLECPINPDRLFPDKEVVGEKEVCDCCDFPIEEKHVGRKNRTLD